MAIVKKNHQSLFQQNKMVSGLFGDSYIKRLYKFCEGRRSQACPDKVVRVGPSMHINPIWFHWVAGLEISTFVTLFILIINIPYEGLVHANTHFWSPAHQGLEKKAEVQVGLSMHINSIWFLWTVGLEMSFHLNVRYF